MSSFSGVSRVPARRRASLSLALVALLVLAPAVWTVPSVAAASQRTLAPELSSAAGAGPTVVVGVSGLRWSDLDPNETPTLWRLVGNGSVGSISVRTVRPITCPIDAWLTLSAGQRALGAPTESTPGAEPGEDDDGAEPDAEPELTTPAPPAPPPTALGEDADEACPPIPQVTDDQVEFWDYFVQLQADELGSYGEPGLLGERLQTAGVCAQAVGRGAAVALANREGQVPNFAPDLDDADLQDCEVTFVDGGTLASEDPVRPLQLEQLDYLVNEIVEQMPENARLLVAGIADVPGVPPGLQAVIQWDAQRPQITWLTSDSTRRMGLVQLTDLTATVLARALVSGEGVEGAPLQTGEERRISTERTVQNRLDLAVLTELAPRLTPSLGIGFLAAMLAVFGAATLAWRLRRRRGRTPALPRSWRGLVTSAAIAAASMPVATFLVTTTSWWTSAEPVLALVASLFVVMVVMVLLAGWPPVRRLREKVWAPTLVVGAVTFVVLTVDAVLGTPLQIGSLLVSGPVEGGRFYGFSNITFAVYAAGAILLAGTCAQWLIDQGRRRLAVATASAIGIIAIVIEGWPRFGADFGGVIALVPGFAVLVLRLADRRVTPHRFGLLLLLAAAVAGSIAVLDWLRPADQRTHLGRFVQRVVDGEATEILIRKAAGALDTVTNVPGAIALVVVVIAITVVLRSDRQGPTSLTRAYEQWPTLPLILRVISLVAVLGALVNDSGVVVAATMLVVTAPLVVVACLRVPRASPPLEERAKEPVPV